MQARNTIRHHVASLACNPKAQHETMPLLHGGGFSCASPDLEGATDCSRQHGEATPPHRLNGKTTEHASPDTNWKCWFKPNKGDYSVLEEGQLSILRLGPEGRAHGRQPTIRPLSLTVCTNGPLCPSPNTEQINPPQKETAIETPAKCGRGTNHRQGGGDHER